MTRMLNLVIVGGLVLAVAGCPPTTTPPNTAAFLEGTWSVTPDDPGDAEGITFEAEFNADGVLTKLTGTRESDGASADLTVTGATTSVTATDAGTDITFTIPRGNVTVTFEGTVSEDENTITGTTSQDVDLGDLDITLPGGELTLERQE